MMNVMTHKGYKARVEFDPRIRKEPESVGCRSVFQDSSFSPLNTYILIMKEIKE